MIRVNIRQLVSGAVTHFRAFRLKDVGNLEGVIARLNYEQRCADELEHVLGQEAHIGHVSIVLSACCLGEGGVRVVNSGLECLHLVLVVVLVVPQTLIVDVEGAVRESPVSNLIILCEYIVHEKVSPHKCGQCTSRTPLKNEVCCLTQRYQRLHKLDSLDDVLMPSEVELLPVYQYRLILIALMTPTIAVLNHKAVPVGEELILSGVSSEHVVVVIGVFPSV